MRAPVVLAALAACGSLAACAAPSPPATGAAAALTDAHRVALADTIRALTDTVIRAGERLDAAALTARFRDGPDVAFGGAGALVLSAERMRDNLAAGYRGLRSQGLEVTQQRVAILGPDGAVTTGWGRFAATDTSGVRAEGIQAFTFAWSRGADGWRVVQAHFSAQIAGMQRPIASPTP